jgi:hypothetical protein
MAESPQIREVTLGDLDDVLGLLGQLWPERSVDPETVREVV